MAGDAVDERQGVLSAQDALTFLDEASAVLAGSLDYERTLGHIAQLMVPMLADWCAIDVVEADGSLRQITSGHPDPEQERLLTDLRRRYREEKAGSEGVTRVIRTGEPELFADVRGRDGARLEIRDEESEVYERLGPKSYVIVPLVARGRTVGAMTLLSTREGRHYVEADLAFAQHLARRFGLAIDNAKLYQDAEAARAGLDDFFSSAPLGLAFFDADVRYVRVNAALARLNGLPIEAHLGHTPGELLGPAGQAAEDMIREVVATGEPVREMEASGPLPWAPGETGHWLVSFTPIRDVTDGITGVSAVVIDVTDRRRALDAEREAARRANFLAEAGALLDASKDHLQLLEELAAFAVPEYADRCLVVLLDEEGEPQPVAGAGPSALSEGSAEVTVPLASRGTTLGSLSFARIAPRTYDEAEVQLLHELGRRAGVAVENARLYTERSRIAHTLQARLLPTHLPEPPGFRLAARYRAAGQFNEVGGDFYDAFQRAPDEWVIVIGDVSGKGPEAAALTAMARYTVRSAALNDWSPAHVLRRLNDTLLREEDTQFVTVALAYVFHSGRDTKVKLVLGGHPPPFVVRAGGGAEAVGVAGTLLGIRTDVRLTQVEVTLEPGDSLVLYTDGVIESGPRNEPFGEHGLLALLEAEQSTDPEALVTAVDEAARAADEGQARDDVAIVALQALAVAPPPDELDLEVRADPSTLRELRESVVDFASRLDGIDIDDVRLAVGEACANVVVHAYRNMLEPGLVCVRALESDGALVVEIRDDGAGPAPRPDSPGLGLGLPLMARLADELQVLAREPSGTLVRMTFRP
ncbi:MAG: SpoIIE family protein phosphatase [Solirubrobacteraceae bacterium]